MAMIDYGAIAWKDGKLISTDMFTDMVDMVGWDDNGGIGLKDNYFAYIGDKDLTVAFYKTTMRIYCKECPYNVDGSDNGTVFFGFERFKNWKYWHDWFYIHDDLVDIKVYHRRLHNYYICKMKYRGHKYKVAFGYGVDLECYKKWRIIDYYSTPWYKFGCWWYYHGRPVVNKIKNYFKIGEKK